MGSLKHKRGVNFGSTNFKDAMKELQERKQTDATDIEDLTIKQLTELANRVETLEQRINNTLVEDDEKEAPAVFEDSALEQRIRSGY